jgi:alpha-beta hydrolase superfamily lysophospholipase
MRRIFKILSGLLAGCVIFLSMLYYLQEKLIFLPSSLADSHVYSFEEPFEEFFITAADGAKLNALHFKREKPLGVILYFHGNAGNLSRWGEVAQELVRLNYDVVVMDYRTYGKSTGELSENALLQDAQLFYEYVSESYNKNEIIVFGRSLGTAMASHLASTNSISLLILETPFYSLLDVAKERFPILPVTSLVKYPFKSHEYLKSANCPIVIFQGDEDNVVPIASAKKLFQSLDGKEVEFITIKGGKHNDLNTFPSYQKGLQRYLLPGN